MTKKEWRKEMQRCLAEIPAQEFAQRCKEIVRKLFHDTHWQQAETIGITISTAGEIDTRSIIMKAWEQEKRVAVPKCDPYSHTMDFHTITSFTDLEKVNFPFFEPKVGQTKKAYPHTIDLLIVPGLVFDYEGYRIGYGGGYFDRYLQHFSNAAVSLALACQVIPQIERESFDQKVNKLITEGMSYEFE